MRTAAALCLAVGAADRLHGAVAERARRIEVADPLAEVDAARGGGTRRLDVELRLVDDSAAEAVAASLRRRFENLRAELRADPAAGIGQQLEQERDRKSVV